MFKGAFQLTRFREPSFFAKRVHEQTWQRFKTGNGSNHSAIAGTLIELVNRCEREGVPYILQAHPGHGYYIKRGSDLENGIE